MKQYVILLSIAALSGCGTPLLHPATVRGLNVSDAGIAGEWESAGSLDIRAVIADEHHEPDHPYSVSLTIHEDSTLKTALSLELALTEIESIRYADLFLSRPERDKLVGNYGFLVLPVHQVMKVSRDGDTLTVWPFKGDWLDSYAQNGDFAHDRVAVGGGDVTIVTAPTGRIRDMMARHGSDPGAFAQPIVLHRIKN